MHGAGMNYLGHLYLADPDPQHRLGGMIGDWVKGRLDGHDLPARVRDGVSRHRAVDHYSDTHPVMRRARARFAGRHRRVAGIALDVLWDHFLIRHWERFGDTSLDAFLDECYGELLTVVHHCPEPMADRVRRIVHDDWIRGYRELDQVGHALRRVGGRLSRDPGLHDIIHEIVPLYGALEADFLRFPLLQPGRCPAWDLNVPWNDSAKS